MKNILGYDPDDLLDKSLYDFHHAADSASLLGSFKSGKFPHFADKLLLLCAGETLGEPPNASLESKLLKYANINHLRRRYYVRDTFNFRFAHPREVLASAHRLAFAIIMGELTPSFLCRACVRTLHTQRATFAFRCIQIAFTHTRDVAVVVVQTETHAQDAGSDACAVV